MGDPETGSGMQGEAQGGQASTASHTRGDLRSQQRPVRGHKQEAKKGHVISAL